MARADAKTDSKALAGAVEAAVLKGLSGDGHAALRSTDLSTALSVEHEVVVGVLRSLESAAMVQLSAAKATHHALTDAGRAYVASGSPEWTVYSAVHADPSVGSTHQELSAVVPADVLKIGVGAAKARNWIRIDADTKRIHRIKPGTVLPAGAAAPDAAEAKAAGGKAKAKKGKGKGQADAAPAAAAAAAGPVVAEVPADTVARDLQVIAAGKAGALSAEAVAALVKRQMMTANALTTYTAVRGPKYAAERQKLLADLKASDLNGDIDFDAVQCKPVNFNAKGHAPEVAALHPLLKVREEFRKILLEMGFAEMPTNRFVESSFWNFDTLLTQQNHPARDLHDTFFLKNPAATAALPADYLARTKDMHEKGGYGSIGFRYDWKEAEARKNVLRTHTTAVSSRMLYALAQQKPFKPVKYFSIDRVFRNETLDATHLAEFHQIEGLIADRNLTLGDLIGTLETFFRRMGITELKFKPTYNPYTEPSMEIFGRTAKGKWLEVGNSGVFRPEMLMPMGFPADVTVIAWGLSLERPTMIRYGYSNIRDLFGHKVKLPLILQNPICRFAGPAPATSATASPVPAASEAAAAAAAAGKEVSGLQGKSAGHAVAGPAAAAAH